MRTDLDAATTYLQSPVAIRARCEAIYKAGLANQLSHFAIDLSRMPNAVDEIVKTMRGLHPDLDFPNAGRMQHFRSPRVADLDAHALIDLVVVSVLLGNGADAFDGSAVGSLSAFEAGMFSSDPRAPLRVDLDGLRALDPDRLAALGFVKTGAMRALSDAMAAAPHLFAGGRPSGMLEVLGGPTEPPIAKVDHDATWPHRLIPSIESAAILRVLLEGLRLDDIGKHPHAGGTGKGAGLVPIHHDAQWLAYSLFEPFERAGYTIAQPGALTGLPDERSAGLLVDFGRLSLTRSTAAIAELPVASIGSTMIVSRSPIASGTL